MNKVRILGVGSIFTGILLGYFFDKTGVHLLSGMLIGLGIGWIITGRFMVDPKTRKSRVSSE